MQVCGSETQDLVARIDEQVLSAIIVDEPFPMITAVILDNQAS
jgi:hypothetical protein